MTSNRTTSRTSSVSGVIHDVSELAELQYHLLRLDAQQAFRAVAGPTILLIAAMVGLLSCMTVLLLGLARLLDEFVAWPAGVMELIIGGVGVLIAAIIAAWTASRYRTATRAFDRSQTELLRNLAWLREATRSQSGNGAPR